MEFTLLGAAAIAVGAIYLTLRFEAARGNAADCTRDVWDALITALVIGLVAGRLAAMVLAGTNPLSSPGDILIVRGGVDTVAASTAGIVAFGMAVRRDLWWLADAAAPAAVAGLAGWHAGCLVRSSCLGTPSDLPWAISQTGSAISRHPVEIYAALALILLAAGLIVARRSRPAAGVIAGAGLAGAAMARLATEPLRPGLGSGLEPWYAAGAITAVAVVAWRMRTRPGDLTDPGSRTL